MEYLIVLGGYLLGSISFAVVVSRLYSLPDPRTYGSGNPGATNVLRSGRKIAAAITLLGDGGKGFAATWLAAAIAGGGEHAGVVVALAGLAVFVGHLFPVFHGFRGGKGVATAAGVLLGFNPWLGLGTILTWVSVAVFFRISSLAALVAALFAPAYAFWLFGWQPSLVGAVGAIAVLLVWRHSENLARLARGEESRIGAKAK